MFVDYLGLNMVKFCGIVRVIFLNYRFVKNRTIIKEQDSLMRSNKNDILNLGRLFGVDQVGLSCFSRVKQNLYS